MKAGRAKSYRLAGKSSNWRLMGKANGWRLASRSRSWRLSGRAGRRRPLCVLYSCRWIVGRPKPSKFNYI